MLVQPQQAATATDYVCPGEDQRAGRWRGREKTECGIHLSLTRVISRPSG